MHVRDWKPPKKWNTYEKGWGTLTCALSSPQQHWYVETLLGLGFNHAVGYLLICPAFTNPSIAYPTLRLVEPNLLWISHLSYVETCSKNYSCQGQQKTAESQWVFPAVWRTLDRPCLVDSILVALGSTSIGDRNHLRLSVKQLKLLHNEIVVA